MLDGLSKNQDLEEIKDSRIIQSCFGCELEEVMTETCKECLSAALGGSTLIHFKKREEVENA